MIMKKSLIALSIILVFLLSLLIYSNYVVVPEDQAEEPNEDGVDAYLPDYVIYSMVIVILAMIVVILWMGRRLT